MDANGDKAVTLDEMTASIQPFEKREEHALHVERDVAQVDAVEARRAEDDDAEQR